jgi:hypothetical protein
MLEAKTFLEQNGTRCPKCRSTKIEFLEHSDDSNDRLFHCEDCAFGWTEIYKMIGYGYQDGEEWIEVYPDILTLEGVDAELLHEQYKTMLKIHHSFFHREPIMNENAEEDVLGIIEMLESLFEQNPKEFPMPESKNDTHNR